MLFATTWKKTKRRMPSKKFRQIPLVPLVRGGVAGPGGGPGAAEDDRVSGAGAAGPAAGEHAVVDVRGGVGGLEQRHAQCWRT